MCLLALGLLAGCGRPPTPTPIPSAAPTPAGSRPNLEPTPVRSAPTSAAEAPYAWWNDRVFYEIFVRSFYDSNGDGIGDLAGLIEKLDYLNDGDPMTTDDLGVTGIWLMPVAQSPSYHGYDVTDYYTVEQDYGSNEDFKRLIAEAHRRDIKVIVDLVLNHTSNQHPWFIASASGPNSDKRDWYIWSAKDDGSRAPWQGGGPVWHKRGDAYYFGLFWEGMPDLNYRNPEVTAEMQRVARFWLEEMGVDGFRLDAVRHLVEEGTTYAGAPATHRWLAQFDDFLDAVDPEALTVGEVWDVTDQTAPYVRGDEVDLVFEFSLADAILNSVARGRPVGTTRELAARLAAYPEGQFATFLTNHDQPRVATVLGKDPAGLKLAATALLTLPGVPFIYYGEEIGMTGSKPDELIRTPMQWSADASAGFTSGRPWQPVNRGFEQVNVAAQDADPDSLLSHYRRLIHLRNAHPAVRRGRLIPVASSCDSTVAFLRQAPAGEAGGPDGQTALVVLNFARKEVKGCTFSYSGDALPAGTYQIRDLLSGSATAPLAVTANGFQSYAPLPNLAARAGHVLLLGQ
ncbi:MAG: alpha-amylase family glycosyl hydrolase [Anaerolineae bacterium]|nr:alpha-amylase family glycosyl hydrolase [Anaerolineae bacterium]